MLEKVGKRGKSALFNLKGGHFIRFVKLNVQSIYWSIVIARGNTINEILMKPYLDLKVLATSLIPSVISSGEFWFKLFVPHKQLLFKRFWQQEDYEHVIEYAELSQLQSHNLRILGVARIWPKHFDIGLTQLLSSLRLLLFRNNFSLTWSIDCDGNLTSSSWKISMGELSL